MSTHSSVTIQDEPSPPQTPHSSSTNPLFATPSQPAHEELSPFNTPQSSVHEELSPAQTPQSSTTAVPAQSPLQSCPVQYSFHHNQSFLLHKYKNRRLCQHPAVKLHADESVQP